MTLRLLLLLINKKIRMYPELMVLIAPTYHILNGMKNNFSRRKIKK